MKENSSTKKPFVKPVYKCNDGTQLVFVQGTKSDEDFIIKTHFPVCRKPYPHTLEYIGQALREKGFVEEINYPTEQGFRGKTYLLDFIKECIFNTEKSVKEICIEYKIPTRNIDI